MSKRMTTDAPSGNFETMLNFVYGKDGWAHIRHDGEHEDVTLTDWAKQQCLLRGCDRGPTGASEDVDQRLCDCLEDAPICPVAMAYCFASQAVHLRSRLKMYEDIMPLDRAQELARAEKDGRLVVMPCKLGAPVWEIGDFDGGNLKRRPFSVEDMSFWRFGITVFLTREEAEAELKKREDAK